MVNIPAFIGTKKLSLFIRSVLLAALSFLPAYTYAQDNIITLTSAEGITFVGNKLFYLEDENGNLTFDDISSDGYQEKFQKNESEGFSRPASANIYWFRIEVKNNTGHDLWLNLGTQFITWRVDLYRPDNLGNYEAPLLLGAYRPQENKEYPTDDYYAKISSSNKVQALFIRLETQAAISTKFSFSSTNTVIKETKHQLMATYLFVGGLAIMIIYSCFLFFSTKSRIYLLYIIYLCSAIINTPFQHGHSLFYSTFLWDSFLINAALSSLPLFLLVRNYLELHVKYKRLYKVALSITGVQVILIPVLSFIVDYWIAVTVIQITALAFILSLLTAVCYAWYKKQNGAGFFAIGWLGMLSGIIVFILHENGLVESNFITRHSLYWGYLNEISLFSLALANRLNTLKREKEEEQAKNLRLVKEQKQELEIRVEQRTQEIQTQNEELKQQQEEIYAINERLALQMNEVKGQNRAINDSIRYAGTIQEAVLPQVPYLKSVFSDAFVLYKSQYIVSGDFFWLEEFKNYTLLAVGDCTGHGVPGAFMSLLGMTFLTEAAKEKTSNQPAEMLGQINKQVISSLKQKHTGNQDGMELLICRIEADRIIFSASKRSLFVVEENGKLQEYKGTRRYIGNTKINTEKKRFQEHVIERKPGMMLYLASDGFQDQLNPARKRFGSLSFKALLEEIAALPCSQQEERLERSFSSHKQNTEQIDDVTVLGVRL